MAALGPQGQKVKELTNKERETVVSFVLGQLHDGALPRGIFNEAAKNYLSNLRNLSKIMLALYIHIQNEYNIGQYEFGEMPAREKAGKLA